MLKRTLALLTLPLVMASTLHAADPLHDPFKDPFFQDPFGDDIFKEMMQMQAQMDKMFERMNQRMLQRTQRAVGPIAQFRVPRQSGFVDKNDHYELLTTIPKSKENHIDIQTKDGMLSITAKVVEEQEHKTPNGIAKSSSVRVYQNAVTLPSDADVSTITTDYKDGRLVVRIAKKGAVTPQNQPLSKQEASASKAAKPAVETKKQESKQESSNNPPKSNPDREKQDDQNGTIKKMTINSDVPSMS